MLCTHINWRKTCVQVKKRENVDAVMDGHIDNFLKGILNDDGTKRRKLGKYCSLEPKIKLLLGSGQGSFNFLDFNVLI